MLTTPARMILTIAVGLAILIADSTGATRLDTASIDNRPMHAAPMVRIPGHVLPALAKATKLPANPSDANEAITLTIVLKRDDQAGFEKYLREVYDPHSKNFRRFLTEQQIADRFGPSRDSYTLLLSYLQKQGLVLVRGSANRLTLSIKGTRAHVRQAFHVGIADYKMGGRTFYANDGDPALAQSLARRIVAVEGLSNLAKLERPHSALWLAYDGNKKCYNQYAGTTGLAAGGYQQLANQCKEGWANAAASYNRNCNIFFILKWFGLCGTLPGPPSSAPRAQSRMLATDSAAISSLDGTGQTIGLLEFDSFNPQDVSDFLALGTVAVPNQISQLKTVQVDGGASIGPNESEVLLDIDTVMTLATGANYVVYSAPFAGISSFADIFNRMLDDKMTIISNSWSACEDQVSQADAQGIDTIFQTAAAAGVSVFNGAGDSGSTCLDGSPNTIGVPADSPNATAVGGSALTAGPAGVYLSETWWNGISEVPPTGQGGFGVSKYFAAPSYQTGIASMRSIPDVVMSADPSTNGLVICQADAGGCPDGLLYGGTSVAAPMFAASAALLNQSHGSNLGALNPLLYPFANTNAFHSAASMSSDFAHVGLGSPNFGIISEDFDHLSPGTPDATASMINLPESGFPADGSTVANVVVQLRDSNGLIVSGKSITLATNSGSNATITPPGAVSSVSNGAATFAVTDSTVETITFTATDTTDGVVLTPQTAPTLQFVVPSSASGSIGAAPPDVPNDGKTPSTITVTLKDSLNRPSPGKLVNISQTGNSVISGPNPQVTDSNGNIQFNAVDLADETVTYTATDVTDGNLPVPGDAQVSFSGSPGNCTASGNPPAAPGFLVTPYATGFTVESLAAGGINFNCFGVYGIGFDSAGNLYANDLPLGYTYKIPPGGGAAGAGTQLNSTSFGTTLAGLAFDGSGNLFISRDVTNGSPTSGVVMQIDPSNGSVINPSVATGLSCPSSIAIDPLSGDLFTDDTCYNGPQSASIFRISDPSGTPSTSVYATTSTTPNATLAFAPSGTIYLWSDAQVVQVSGTNVSGPPAVTVLPGIQISNIGLLAGGQQADGDADYLIYDPYVLPSGKPQGVQTEDLTTSPPTLGTSFAGGVGGTSEVFGPDGCVYVGQGATVYRISDTSGGCSYSSSLASPQLVLSPSSVSSNPAKGTPQTFTADFHYAGVTTGTPVLFSVSGANPQTQLVNANSIGQAAFSYAATHEGIDTITAFATVNSSPLASNQAVVTWDEGADTTFLTLNLSPKGGTPGNLVNLTASLADISQDPVVPVAGQPVTLGLGNDTCSASTDANGNASCQINPVIIPGNPSRPLTASFAGTADLTAANASTGFTFTAPPEDARLRVTPKTLDFPAAVELGGVGATSKPHIVTVFNPKNKKQKLTVTFLGAEDTGDFTIVSGPPTTCDATLAPKARCKIALIFSPTATGARTGTLMVDDNADVNNQQMVKLKGKGEQGKLSYSPASLSFGKQAVNTTSKAKTVKIANRNPVPMTFAADTSGDYHIASNTCASTLPAKSTCEIEVTFEPTGTGSQPGTLTFTDDAARSPQVVKLEGSGE